MNAVIVAHDAAAPDEHLGLDVRVMLNDEGLVDLVQGMDRILMPPEHARRVTAALSELLSVTPDDDE